MTNVVFVLILMFCLPAESMADCPLGPPTGLFAGRHGVAIYKNPDINSDEIGHLGKGYPLVTVRIPTCREGSLGQEEWIRIDRQTPALVSPVGVMVPAGWIRRKDFLEAKDFRRINSWPFSFLVAGPEMSTPVYCFKQDGTLIWRHFTESNDNPVGVKRVLYQSGEIIAASEFADRSDIVTPFALLDSAHQRLCPVGLTNNECERFLTKDIGYSWRFALRSEIEDDQKNSPLKVEYEQYCEGKENKGDTH
jgi:hypothetical protein